MNIFYPFSFVADAVIKFDIWDISLHLIARFGFSTIDKEIIISDRKHRLMFGIMKLETH